MTALRPRVFLISPANCSGQRARLLRRPAPGHDLGRRLHAGDGVPLGEVFSFVSSLYFRGKLSYARTFARTPAGVAGVHVITPCDGLRGPDTLLTLSDIGRYAAVDVALDEPRYREPLLRDLRTLAPSWGDADVVLLGSVASAKYVDLLAPALGERLHFPADFVGRGDMSRGGLLLRAVEARHELEYRPLAGAERRGARPARLTPRRNPAPSRS